MIYAEERYNRILELLSQKGRVDSSELVDVLNTSRETIRRDLNKLAEEGHLIKTHGGAILPDHTASGFDFPFTAREKAHPVEKADICAWAAQNIHEPETIFLDNSSTVGHLLEFIPRQYKLNILVNSVPLLLRFCQMQNPNWNIISLGGSLVYPTMSVNRYLTTDALKNFRPTKAFLSCHSIDENFIATDSYLDDVELKRYAAELSEETYLLVDHSKLNRSGVMKIADATLFDHIVTDEKADPDFLAELKTLHGSVHLAPTRTK